MILRIKLVACVSGAMLGIGFLIWFYARTSFVESVNGGFRESALSGVRGIFENLLFPMIVVYLSLRIQRIERALAAVFFFSVVFGFLRMTVLDPAMDIDMPGMGYVVETTFLVFVSMIVCAIKGLSKEAIKTIRLIECT